MDPKSDPALKETQEEKDKEEPEKGREEKDKEAPEAGRKIKF